MSHYPSMSKRECDWEESEQSRRDWFGLSICSGCNGEFPSEHLTNDELCPNCDEKMKDKLSRE